MLSEFSFQPLIYLGALLSIWDSLSGGERDRDTEREKKEEEEEEEEGKRDFMYE